MIKPDLLYFDHIVLDMLDQLEVPTLVPEDVILKDESLQSFCKEFGLEIDPVKMIYRLVPYYHGVIINTTITSLSGRNMWLVVPEHYLNAKKINVSVSKDYEQYIGRLIGIDGCNAKRAVTVINSIKHKDYQDTISVIFNQRKNRKD